jgi:hypothetical protein
LKAPGDFLSAAETLVGLAANAACEKLHWKFFFGQMSLISLLPGFADRQLVGASVGRLPAPWAAKSGRRTKRFNMVQGTVISQIS